MLQPSNDPVVAISYVPSDFLVDGQLRGLGTVHPLLTLDFISTWFPPLHMKTLSSEMDGFQKKEEREDISVVHTIVELFYVWSLLALAQSVRLDDTIFRYQFR